VWQSPASASLVVSVGAGFGLRVNGSTCGRVGGTAMVWRASR
jgi:hypothetical protein